MNNTKIEILPTIAKDDAQEYMNNLLMDITGTDTLEQANMILVGRPRLGSKNENTETIQFKVPASWKELVSAEAKRRQISLSDYMRELMIAGHNSIATVS